MFGLALGSGGAKGFAHIGVLKVIEELGVKPDIIVGSSMGAIVGGFYASGMPLSEIETLATSMNYKSLIKMADFGGGYVIRGDKLEKFFREKIPVKRIEKFPIRFAAVSTNIIAGKCVAITRGDAAKAMRASGSIPAIFKPVEYKRTLLVDGGVLNPVPVKIARELGADLIIGVNVNGRVKSLKKKNVNTITLVIQSIELMQSKLAEYNRDALILKPRLENFSSFSFSRAKEIIKIGYNTAKRMKGRIKRFLDL